TPYEFWSFYKDNVTPNKLALLRLPVKEFVSKDDQPSEKDLKTLFNQYKEKEPSPERDKPGFKQPRRVAVEWVSARADSEFYQRSSKIVADLTQVTLPVAYGAALLENYGYEKTRDFQLPPLTEASFALPFYTRRMTPPEAAGIV